MKLVPQRPLELPHPEVPSERFSGPMGQLVAAILYSRGGFLNAAEVPMIAAHALATGADTKGLRDLALLSRNSNTNDILDCLAVLEGEMFADLPGIGDAWRWLLYEYWLLCLRGKSAPVGLTLALILYEGPPATHTRRPPKDREALFKLLDEIEDDPDVDRRDQAASLAGDVLREKFPSVGAGVSPQLLRPAHSPVALFGADGEVQRDN